MRPKSKPVKQSNGSVVPFGVKLPLALSARLSAWSKFRKKSAHDIVVEVLESATPTFADLGAAAQTMGDTQPT